MSVKQKLKDDCYFLVTQKIKQHEQHGLFQPQKKSMNDSRAQAGLPNIGNS